MTGRRIVDIVCLFLGGLIGITIGAAGMFCLIWFLEKMGNRG